MLPKPRSQWSFAGLVGASVLIHATALASLEPLANLPGSVAGGWKKLMAPKQEKERSIQFEFIETPKNSRVQELPKDTKKISNRAAEAQDTVRDKSQAGELPSIANISASDQLAQSEGAPSQKASPLSEPVAAKQAVEAQPAEEAKSEETPTLPKTEDAMEIKSVPAQAAPESPETAIVPQNPVLPKPASLPQLGSEGGGGGDKITTQEFAKKKSPGAKFYGSTSFEATGSGMGAYMKNMKEKVWMAWFPYLAFKYPQDMKTADVVLSLVIDKRGDVKMVRVVEYKGSELFASYCMQAIQKASSFGPLPEEILGLIGKEELELRFGFHYR